MTSSTNKGADLQLDTLSTLPWMDGEAVFEKKPLSAAFLELACREQVYLPRLLTGSFTVRPLMYRMTAGQFDSPMKYWSNLRAFVKRERLSSLCTLIT